MSDHANPEATAGSFRAQVERLVAEGKLTAEEADGLLEGTDEAPSFSSASNTTIAEYVQAVQNGDSAGLNLNLEIEGYVLSVVQDSNLSTPQLSASQDGILQLSATPNGLTLKRARHSDWRGVKAVLTLPVKPQHVKVEINGGSLSLCDLTGEMRAEVNGGNVTMNAARGLNAEVNGGNFTAGDIHGPTKLEVNGGNLTVTHSLALDAEVNGGNLRWTGVLTNGTHRAEVNAGNATLALRGGSSVRLDADVTLGNFKADFPTQKRGGLMEAQYTGQLGSGEALLRCEVTTGQLRVVTE